MKRRDFLLAAAAILTGLPANASAVNALAAILDNITGDADLRARSGDSFFMGDQEYRLADIIAPSTAAPDMAEPFAAQATNILQRLLQEGVDELRDAAPPDRWRRKIIIASRFAKNNDASETSAKALKQSLQSLLIAEGAARVRPQTGEQAFIRDLLMREEDARRRRAGLWRLAAYNVWPADNAQKAVGAYQLIEGVVVNASERRARTYINFGADYKTDMTASIRSSLARRWREAGFDVLALEGRRIRVRGFVEWINGPSIALTHKQQIELPG